MYRKSRVLLGGSLQSVSVQMTDIGIECCLFRIGRVLLGTWEGFCFTRRGLHTANVFFFSCDSKGKKSLNSVMNTSRQYLILLFALSGYV